MESTLAGLADCLFSDTSAAAVTCGIIKPEFSPGRGDRNAGNPERAGSMSIAILRSANPKLREKAAAEAAAMIGHVLKLVPMLAKEEEDGGQPLVTQVRKMLAAYIESAG